MPRRSRNARTDPHRQPSLALGFPTTAAEHTAKKSTNGLPQATDNPTEQAGGEHDPNRNDIRVGTQLKFHL